MSEILTPTQLPLAALIGLLLYAIFSFLFLKKAQLWLAILFDSRFLKEDLGPTRHTFYICSLCLAALYLLHWSGVAERYHLVHYLQWDWKENPIWVWALVFCMLSLSMAVILLIDRHWSSKQENAAKSSAYRSILWSTGRRFLYIGYGVSLLSAFYYLAGHLGLIDASGLPALEQGVNSQLVFRCTIYVVYAIAILLLSRQVFDLLARRDWGQVIDELHSLRRNGLKLLLLLGAIIFLPINDLLIDSNAESWLSKTLFELPLIWLGLYLISAYLFARSFYSAFSLFEAEFDRTEGSRQMNYLQNRAKHVSEKTRSLLPGIANFLVSEKENFLRCSLTFLLLLIVPLGKFLTYALVLQCYFINRILVDAAYDLFIEDIRFALLKRQHLLLNLIAKILGKLQWPLILLLSCLQAMFIMPNPALVSKGLLVVSSFIALAILFELIDWYAQSITRKYMRADAPQTTETLEADGFPVFTLMAKSLVVLVISLGLLSSFGFDVTSIITGLGVAGFAIALALQSLLSDVFASVAISIDKPFTIGDFISVDKLSGRVEKIGVKTTRIRTREGQEVAVPNTKLTSFDVHNFNRMQHKVAALDFSISHRISPDQLERIPDDLKSITEHLDAVEFQSAGIKSIGAEAIDYQLTVRTDQRLASRETMINHQLYQQIHRYLHHEGIEPANAQNSSPDRPGNNPAKPKLNRGLGRMY